MNVQARFDKESDIRDYIPTTAKVAGEVVVLDDGKAGICNDAIAANALGSVQVSGIVEINNAAVSGSAGSPVGWDEDANPVSGTAGTGAITTYLGDADFIIGMLAEDLASTDTSAKVVLNEYNPAKPIFEGMTFEKTAVDKTLDIQDVGKVIIVTADAKTITLPATAAGLGPIVIVNGCADAAALVTIAPNSNDKIMGPDIAGADNTAIANTKATAKHWDYIKLHPDIAGNGWEIQAKRGIWA
jgi:hypothetical protein